MTNQMNYINGRAAKIEDKIFYVSTGQTGLLSKVNQDATLCNGRLITGDCVTIRDCIHVDDLANILRDKFPAK